MEDIFEELSRINKEQIEWFEKYGYHVIITSDGKELYYSSEREKTTTDGIRQEQVI